MRTHAVTPRWRPRLWPQPAVGWRRSAGVMMTSALAGGSRSGTDRGGDGLVAGGGARRGAATSLATSCGRALWAGVAISKKKYVRSALTLEMAPDGRLPESVLGKAAGASVSGFVAPRSRNVHRLPASEQSGTWQQHKTPLDPDPLEIMCV